MAKTYRFRNPGGQGTVQALSSRHALTQAIQSLRRGRNWQPDGGSAHSIARLVSVVCVDDANDEASDFAQMWP